ncbi:MAG: DUF1559 domain-containing protein [Planctomycetales bacterium]|nr:DUF1559 domain-containing protein [Planctomycetales bacterium]
MSSPSQGADSRLPVRFRFTLRRLLFWMAGWGVVFASIAYLANLVTDARRHAIASVSQGPLNQLTLALHNYHDTFGSFPPAYVADAAGRPIHSWRVLILPYIEQRGLYDEYDFSEPWDGPRNSRLLNRMPEVFHSFSERPSDCFTNIVAVTGPETAFPGAASVSLSQIGDGVENTLLLAEIGDSRVPWLQPLDVDVVAGLLGPRPIAGNSARRDPNGRTSAPNATGHGRSETPFISAVRWRRPMVTFADSISAYSLSPDIPPDALESLATINGGEPDTRQRLLDAGLLRHGSWLVD